MGTTDEVTQFFSLYRVIISKKSVPLQKEESLGTRLFSRIK
jgi:hypothetical protein